MRIILYLKSWQLFLVTALPMLALNECQYWGDFVSWIGLIIYGIWIRSIYIYSETTKTENHTMIYHYAFVIFLVMATFASFYQKDVFINDIIGGILAIITILCFLYMTILSSIAFNKWTIKTNNYLFNAFGAFIFLICYPIGIWIIQPKLNKMINNK